MKHIPDKNMTIEHYFYNDFDVSDYQHQDNTTGVFYEKDRNRWVREWRDNGKKKRKCFSANKFGYSVAYKMARDFEIN